jgi:hypothetical protein
MLSVVNKHSSGLGAFFAGAGQDSGEEIDKKNKMVDTTERTSMRMETQASRKKNEKVR